MTTTAKICLAVVALLVFTLAGVFGLRIFKQRNDRIQTGLIEKQKKEQEFKEYQEAMKEKKEIAAIKNGLDKMIGGKIESIDKNEKSFVVDLDALGSHQRYTIHTTEKTEFKITYIDTKIVDENAEETEDRAEETEAKFDANFDQLKEQVDVQIEFSKRLDIDKEKKLTATKVNAVYFKTIE